MVPLAILAIDDPVKYARYEAAYLNYEQHLIGVAMSLLKDNSLAEDVLHDTFEAIIAAEVLPEDTFKQKALLTTVIKNKALDMLKHQKFMADREPSDAQLGVVYMPEKIELDMLIERLPDIYKDVLVMYYELDLSAKKIASVLGISYDTVLKRLERARNLLRKEYLEED